MLNPISRTNSSLQLAKDGTLRDHIKPLSGMGGERPEQERIRLVRQLAAGMQYLHEQEVRDPSTLNNMWTQIIFC